MANFGKLLKHIPTDKIWNAGDVVQSNLRRRGWEVTIGLPSTPTITDYLLGQKPFKAVLFLIDGDAWVSAVEAVRVENLFEDSPEPSGERCIHGEFKSRCPICRR